MSYPMTGLCTAKFKRIRFIFSKLGLSVPAKHGLERSVRTTSFSTVHWTFLLNHSSSSPIMFSLKVLQIQWISPKYMKHLISSTLQTTVNIRTMVRNSVQCFRLTVQRKLTYQYPKKSISTVTDHTLINNLNILQTLYIHYWNYKCPQLAQY